MSVRTFLSRIAAGCLLALLSAPASAAVVVLPYVQPGNAVLPEGLDEKLIVWFADGAPGNYAVEYGWTGAAARQANAVRTDITIPAPTAEQIKKNKSTKKEDKDEPDDDAVPALPLGDREQKYTRFIATLPELPRGTAVWYRVRESANVIGEGTFKTRAEAGKTIRFVAVGDLANGKAGQNAVAFHAAAQNPDFLLALGDITYPTGRVSQYMDHYWSTYRNVPTPSEKTGAPLMANVPFYALPGNHDCDTSLNAMPDSLGLYYFFQAPKNGPGEGKWNTPISRDKQETARFRAAVGDSYPSLAFYSFDEGPVHFTVLDSNGYVKIDSPELLKWIERDISGSKARWKVVLTHAPLFHSSPAHYTEQKMRNLSPLLEKLGVDVVLSGHVHNYQRSHPLRFQPGPPPEKATRLISGTFQIDTTFDGKTNTQPKGIVHIVTGGGGGTLYKDPVEKTASFMKEKYGDNWAPYTARHVVDRHSFVLCEVSPDVFTLRAIDQAGKPFDEIRIQKR